MIPVEVYARNAQFWAVDDKGSAIAGAQIMKFHFDALAVPTPNGTVYLSGAGTADVVVNNRTYNGLPVTPK